MTIYWSVFREQEKGYTDSNVCGSFDDNKRDLGATDGIIGKTSM